MKKMVNRQSLAISNWSSDKIINTFQRNIFKYAFSAYLIITVAFYLYLIGNSSTIITKLFAIVLLVVLILFFYLKYLYRLSVQAIISENLNLSKYLSIYEYQASHGRKTLRELDKNNLYLVKSNVHYLRGNFEASLSALYQCDFSKLKKRQKIQSEHFRLTIFMLIALALKNEELISQFETELSASNLVSKFKVPLEERYFVLKDLFLKGKSNDYYETKEAKNRLEHITFTYYRAINAQLKGDEVRARALFESIQDEPDELFYVREAKQYLEGDQ